MHVMSHLEVLASVVVYLRATDVCIDHGKRYSRSSTKRFSITCNPALLYYIHFIIMATHNSDTASEFIETSTSSASIDGGTSIMSGSSLVTVKLTAEDIPGAELEEPLARHGVPALQWWLICNGIKTPSTWRKSQLIDR